MSDLFTIEEYGDRISWLVGRTRGPNGTASIGASETAVLFGEGFKSPRALYEAKLHPELFMEEESERMYWGSRLEPVIAEELTVRYGWKLDDFGRYTTLRSIQWPWLTATLDRRIQPIDARGYGVAECKNSGFFMRDEWNDAGAPLWIQVQGQSQLAVTGYQWGVFPVLLGGCEWRMVEFDRDEEFIQLIVAKSAAFCHHVHNRVPPPVDGDESTTDALKRRYGRDDGSVIKLPAEALEWDTAIAAAQKVQAEGAEIEALHRNRIREVLGDATSGDLPDGSGRWNWKANKNGVRALKRGEIPKGKGK